MRGGFAKGVLKPYGPGLNSKPRFLGHALPHCGFRSWPGQAKGNSFLPGQCVSVDAARSGAGAPYVSSLNPVKVFEWMPSTRFRLWVLL